MSLVGQNNAAKVLNNLNTNLLATLDVDSEDFKEECNKLRVTLNEQLHCAREYLEEIELYSKASLILVNDKKYNVIAVEATLLLDSCTQLIEALQFSDSPPQKTWLTKALSLSGYFSIAQMASALRTRLLSLPWLDLNVPKQAGYNVFFDFISDKLERQHLRSDRELTDSSSALFGCKTSGQKLPTSSLHFQYCPGPQELTQLLPNRCYHQTGNSTVLNGLVDCKTSEQKISPEVDKLSVFNSVERVKNVKIQ
jgi:hypothetical protein